MLLMALGASSLILRTMGRQPMVMSILGAYERPAAIAFLGIGVALLAYGFWKKKKKEAPKAT